MSRDAGANTALVTLPGGTLCFDRPMLAAQIVGRHLHASFLERGLRWPALVVWRLACTHQGGNPSWGACGLVLSKRLASQRT